VNGFDFNFDAFNAPEVSAPVEEEKPAEDDGWGFSFGNKKGSAALLEESTSEQELAPAP
jgi:hypothetical protein